MTDAKKETGTDLAVAGPGGVSTGSMLQAFISALTDPRVDAAKMPVVADTLIKLREYERQEEYSRDKAAAIAAMPVIDKRGRVVIPAKDGKPERLQSRFSKWEDIHAAVTPVLTAHNLVLNHLPGHVDKMPAVAAVLTHANGYSERSEFMPLPIDNSGSKNPTQGVGSALSYGQRYTTILMLNIRQQNVDDDAQSAGLNAPAASSLTDHEQELADLASDAAGRGAQSYASWFAELSPAQKGWLVYSGRHEALKTRAAEKGA